MRINRTEITWIATKFGGVKFTVEHLHKEPTSWEELFKKLRISLNYGLNPQTRAITDRMRGIEAGDKNPIHRRVVLRSMDK